MGASPKNIVTAGSLSHDHIGSEIRVYTIDGSQEIFLVHTGELRQLSAHEGQVNLLLGLGAEHELTLSPGHPVALLPGADYSEVPLLVADTEREIERNG